MNKLGLIFEFIGFAMLFWQSFARPSRSLKSGGGVSTDSATEHNQIERALSWIPWRKPRQLVSEHWPTIAFGFVAVGVLIQLVLCPK